MNEGGSYTKDPITGQVTLIERTDNGPVDNQAMEPVEETAAEAPADPVETFMPGKTRKTRE